MAPVIRISDELFRRLQAYGRPLVDTPASVIERILDTYESQAPRPAVDEQSPLIPASVRPAGTVSTLPQLFFTPASGANLNATIVNAASFRKIRSALSDGEAQRIAEILDGRDEIRCWAMTESRRGVFSSMRTGDVVLFTEKGSGTFSYRAEVIGKIDSQRLGEVLWSVVPGKPWSLIYFLRNVRRVSIPKAALVSALGFSADYWVPGILRVDDARLKSATRRYGSLDLFLDSLRR
ncbi:MAG: hypothetical protein IT359_10915 [Gemmatimonadaceae bacterium]|nr:hypothetical protein [Gemmatimonadaceae bacterium]